VPEGQQFFHTCLYAGFSLRLPLGDARVINIHINNKMNSFRVAGPAFPAR